MRGWNLKSFRETELFKRISVVIITALITGVLFGCDALDELSGSNDKITFDTNSQNTDGAASVTTPGAIQVIDINGDIHETSVSVIDEAEAEDGDAEALPARSLAEVAQNLSLSDDSNFAYSELNDSAKLCYGEIYAVLTDMLEKVELSSKDPDEVDLAFRAVMLDHPEIFYVKGYSIGKYMNGQILKRIVFSGTYTMPKDRVERGREEVDAYVDRVIAGCPEGDDYDKIKYVYEYLIRNNEYVPESENNQNILSVVENGQTVCQGYTKAMQLILNKMGIFCTLVNGRACGQEGVPDSEELANAQNVEWGGHVWNIVKCNGMYYNVDVTWGDAVIKLMSDDGTLSRDVEMNYEFFLVDDPTLDDNHDPEPVVNMPRCTSMEDNYYRHEGLYFTEVNTDQFRRVFDNALSLGERYLFIKASSPEVYEQIKRHLFEEQNIFEYMGGTNVRYVEFSDRNLMMISL